MKISFTLFALLLTYAAACAGEPFRRPIEKPEKDGWVRVLLDADAQANLTDSWIGDEKGAAIPFQRLSSMNYFGHEVSVEDEVIGRDARGFLTAEFRLSATRNYSTTVSEPAAADSATDMPSPVLPVAGEHIEPDARRTVTLSLDVDANAPWVAEVQVDRRKKGGAWLTIDKTWQIYDFGSQGREREISVPWDAGEWRLRVVPIQGKLRSLDSLSASGVKYAFRAPRSIDAVVSEQSNGMRVDLGKTPVQVVGFEIVLSGTVAPIEPAIRVERVSMLDPKKMDYDYVAATGLLWRMPGLKSESTRIELRTPATGNVFFLTLPENAKADKVRALVSEDELLFVGEAGQNYFLHQGGLMKRAAGDLSSLPEDRDQVTAPLLTLRAAEADPHGIPFRPEWSERLKPFLPWVVGVAVAILAFFAWRLVKPVQVRSTE